jgi:hypothetical protein
MQVGYCMFENFIEVLNCLALFFLGYMVLLKCRRRFKVSNIRVFLIYIWHTVFCFAYLIYVEKFGGDALMYYTRGVAGDIDFKPGTAAVYTLTTFLVHGLGFGKLSCFLLFNIFGSIGLLAVDAALKKATRNKSKYIKILATLFVFLPSLSFWSAGIGKDSISFMAMGLALWASLQLNQRMKLMVFAVLIMSIVRPHMGALMLTALSFAFFLDKNISFKKRTCLVIVGFSIAVALIPFALNYAGISDYSNPSAVVDYIEKRQTYNMNGGGGVDISSMSLPMQLFTYMFRPVIFEVNSIASFAAAIDNTILLFLFIIGSIHIFKRKRKKSSDNRTFMWVYSLLAWIILASTSANLGISLRQKWMFVPILFYLLISLIGKDKSIVRLPVQILKPQVSKADTSECKALNIK